MAISGAKLVYALDGRLFAQMPQRFRTTPEGVLKQLTENPKAILFIDEITQIGAGAASGGARCVAC
jgi:ATP-dependent Clp protease ATP-binding subunit ClpA